MRLTDEERERLDYAVNATDCTFADVEREVERIVAERLAPIGSQVSTWDAWCLAHCPACRGDKRAIGHAHDCGITRREVVARLREVLPQPQPPVRAATATPTQPATDEEQR